MARFSLNSQQQTRTPCATVWDFALLLGTAPRMLAGRTAARDYTSLVESRVREGPYTRGDMGLLESSSTQQGETDQPTEEDARFFLALVHEVKAGQLNALLAWLPHVQIKEMGKKGKGNHTETQEEAEAGSSKQTQAGMKLPFAARSPRRSDTDWHTQWAREKSGGQGPDRGRRAV